MPEWQAVFAPATLTHISAPYLHYVVTSLRFICYNNTHHITEMKTNQLKVITFIRQHGKKIDHLQDICMTRFHVVFLSYICLVIPPWRILVLVIKWRHHANGLLTPVAAKWLWCVVQQKILTGGRSKQHLKPKVTCREYSDLKKQNEMFTQATKCCSFLWLPCFNYSLQSWNWTDINLLFKLS